MIRIQIKKIIKKCQNIRYFLKKEKKRGNQYHITSIIDKEYFKKFVYEWNINNPMDRWWREKHGIRFNSPEHRVVSFLDQMFEYEEDKVYRDILKPPNKNPYNPRKHNYMVEVSESEENKMSNEDMAKLFEDQLLQQIDSENGKED